MKMKGKGKVKEMEKDLKAMTVTGGLAPGCSILIQQMKSAPGRERVEQVEQVQGYGLIMKMSND